MGVDVQRRTSRADVSDPRARIKRMQAAALDGGILTGALRVPDAIADLQLELLLQGKVVRYSVSFRAPADGRTKTRLNWLLREFRGAPLPNGLKLRIDWDRRGLYSEAAIDDVREDHGPLMVDPAGAPIRTDALPRMFTLSWATGLAKGGGRAGGRVLDGIAGGVERFYRQVVEGLVPHTPRAPRLPAAEPDESNSETFSSGTMPAQSSTDSRERPATQQEPSGSEVGGTDPPGDGTEIAAPEPPPLDASKERSHEQRESRTIHETSGRQ